MSVFTGLVHAMLSLLIMLFVRVLFGRGAGELFFAKKVPPQSFKKSIFMQCRADYGAELGVFRDDEADVEAIAKGLENVADRLDGS